MEKRERNTITVALGIRGLCLLYLPSRIQSESSSRPPLSDGLRFACSTSGSWPLRTFSYKENWIVEVFRGFEAEWRAPVQLECVILGLLEKKI